MKTLLIAISLLLLQLYANAQFTVNGDATVVTPQCSASTNTYQLTPASTNQAGAVWSNVPADLNRPFDVHFEMFLGYNCYGCWGADGICFVFQQQGTKALGHTGMDMGFGGISPSLGIEFDSYENGFDPGYCHTAIDKNGDVDHNDTAGNLAGPVQLDPDNPLIPDSNWHNVEVTWNPATKTISVYFDCYRRLFYYGDIINTVFGGNAIVWWGFTGGTGNADNIQQVCVAPPAIGSLRDTSICIGDSVSYTVSGGGTYLWNNGDTTATIHVTPSATTTYLVTVTNGLCINNAVATVAVYSYPVPAISPDATICQGDSVKLTASGSADYAWAPSAGLSCDNCAAPKVSPAATTQYTVTYSNGPCTATDSVLIKVNTIPDIMLCCDTIIGPGQAVQLTSSGTGVYSWSPAAGLSCTNCANPLVYTDISVTYTLTITSDSNCPVSRSVTIDVSCGTVFIPEAFSPGNLSANNRLYVRGDCIKTLDFMVFDRWGNKVFETNDKNNGWDGTYKGEAMNTGSYVYYISAAMYDGTTFEKKGNVALVR
ncbi:MAG: lectin-like domain-containing protein [Bacteroidia bacterium]